MGRADGTHRLLNTPMRFIAGDFMMGSKALGRITRITAGRM
jgi:hypothetical protein